MGVKMKKDSEERPRKKSRVFRFFIKILIICAAAYLLLNMLVLLSSSSRIVPADEVSPCTCVMILGAGIRSDGTPTLMLKDRLDTGIALYKSGKAVKILMSGDHATKEYDEVNAMKAYAIDAGIPEEDIFCDHAGLSTYDSVYRAKHIFGQNRLIIVSQSYHLFRALYIAGVLEIDASGVSADLHDYRFKYDLFNYARESVARCKDAIFSIFKPQSQIGGDPIPITPETNGNITNG